MKEELFVKALGELRELASEQGNVLSWEQISEIFEEADFTLNDERKALIEDYLKTNHIGIGEAVDPDSYLSEEEKNFLNEYLEEIKELAEISDGEKKALIISALAGESDAKSRLIEIMLPSVADIAKLYTGFGVSIEDLIGEGNVALTMAMDMFECVEGPDEVEGFIAGRAMDAMEEFIKENTDLKKADDKMLGKINRIAEMARELSEELGRDVTPEEIAKENNISVKSVRDAMLITGDKIDGISKGQTT
ncbi:MAG: hypothetical protein IKY04_06475 [Lachnospiraceae bacterium]|nr:hypothetical protein [Lachnospiraceae bacterium]